MSIKNGLNLSKFQKVAEDDKTVTMAHEKGHKMVIALHALPRIQREQIKRLKMAEGGIAENKDGQPPVTVNVNPAIGQPTQSPVVPPPQNISVPGSNVLLPNGSMNAPAAAQTAQKAAELGAKIQAAQSAAAVPQEQQYLNQTAALNQDFANNLNDVKSKADEFNAYLKENPLKENAYLENMGAKRKIGTALGLILSGAGSGLSGQTNMAYDFLNKQIDRNIDAQKSRFGQQQTVWGAYKDLYQNEQVANNMARVHALYMLEHQARLTAAQLGTPRAQKELLDLQSKLAPERNKLILESAGNLSSTPNMPAGGGIEKTTEAQKPGEPNITNGPLTPDQVRNLHSPISGISQGNASLIPSKKVGLEPDEYADTPILAPDYEQKKEASRYLPKIKEQSAQVQHDYEQALKADAVLSQLHGVHQKMYQDAITGGSSGYIRRHNPVGAIPYVGEAGSELFIKPVTDTPENRSYDALRTRIAADVAQALKGTNVSSEEVTKMIDKNIPEHGDSEEMVAKKERNIRIFIKNAVDKGLLQEAKIARKYKGH